MPQVHFESIGGSLSRLPGVLRTVQDIIRDPSANPLQSAILLGVGLVSALILVITLFLVMTRPSAEERALLAQTGLAEEPETLSAEERASARREAVLRRRATATTVTSLVILAWVGVWLVAGLTTSSNDVCTSCHTNTSHTAAGKSDPHAKVACVDCHEGGGAFARISVNVLSRMEHVTLAQTDSKAASDFGKPVASDACLACHGKQLQGTYYDARLHVKVSHAEPLAAGAECVDCHALKSGVVGATTVGMSSCLRCHGDGKRAKAGCEVCHDGDPSLAIRPTIEATAMAAVQVANPGCGGCHTDMTRCNACHGISMPHTVAFEQSGHARAAAEAIWSNNLGMCRKCHYAGHNDCQQFGCHVAPFPAHPSPAWQTLHASAPWAQSNTTCACHKWNPYDHNGMNFCEICHPVKPKNAR